MESEAYRFWVKLVFSVSSFFFLYKEAKTIFISLVAFVLLRSLLPCIFFGGAGVACRGGGGGGVGGEVLIFVDSRSFSFAFSISLGSVLYVRFCL